MFIRFSALLPVAALVAVVAAAPSDIEARQTTTTQCDTGSQQCCTTTYDQTLGSITSLGLVGLVLPQVGALLGTGCTPITVIGTGAGATCTQQPVCCTNTVQNGLVNVGCTPIALAV